MHGSTYIGDGESVLLDSEKFDKISVAKMFAIHQIDNKKGGYI